jgi:hypothetical protein
MLEITYNTFGIWENIFKFSINIHSLREYEGDKQKVDLILQTHKLPLVKTLFLNHKAATKVADYFSSPIFLTILKRGIRRKKGDF